MINKQQLEMGLKWDVRAICSHFIIGPSENEYSQEKVKIPVQLWK